MPTALLCILDGWGWRPDPAPDNAIAAARTPNYTRLLAECPHALLATSGGGVGLPLGQMGNSEVGHMNIGSGRIVAQDLPRIDVAIEDGTLATRPALRDLIAKAEAAPERPRERERENPERPRERERQNPERPRERERQNPERPRERERPNKGGGVHI